MSKGKDKRQDLVDKIKAMLAMTRKNGASEQEELMALAKAQALMAAHVVTDEELALSKDEAAILHDHGDIYDPHGVKWQLCHGLERFCHVMIYSEDGRYKFIGLRSDVDYADFLLGSGLD
jgi:hypothetical protein